MTDSRPQLFHLTNCPNSWRHLCTVRVDSIGDIFARRAGLCDDPPPVMAGSHINTQPTDGKFDGNCGVLAGQELLRTPLEVVVWTNEEGSRFAPVMMGSGAFTLEHALAQYDRDGVPVRDTLEANGYAGEHRKSHAVGTYFEAHNEQVPVLAAHAGPTPMALRRDALPVAADVIHAVNRIALDHAPPGRGTIGWLDVYPTSRNVIPGRVKLSVDLRGTDNASLTKMDHALRAACAQPATTRGNAATNSASSSIDNPIAIDIEQIVSSPPQPFAAQWVADVGQSAERPGLLSMALTSTAGHEAVYLARVAPTAMIFMPCKDGINHNEIEDARANHPKAGCNVLLRVMLNATSKAGSLRP